ncbi:MAG TPA: DUF3427 domain-containing protein [Bacteroidetes bacterium]|nr:DUF3427 domain-containing protein [Bacteroidota bacterium]
MEALSVGLYEQLINKLFAQRLGELDRSVYYVQDKPLDKAEAARYLTQYVASTIHFALNSVANDDRPGRQIELINKIILLLIDEIRDQELSENLLEAEGTLLEAVINKLDSPYADLKQFVRDAMPYTRLSQSELFTGSSAGLSLDTELKKEILSADRICFMVSFIKWSGIRIFKQELESFTRRGQLQVITTSYMGATDQKAVDFLASLPNTEVKVSYNTRQERLHAKAYLFLRNTGYHTGYIGSSNLSRSALTNGLEWNMKVTTREIQHIIDKFIKTYDTYWNDKEFEQYRPGMEADRTRLAKALKSENRNSSDEILSFFDLKPYSFQQEILEKLDSERENHGRYRNLIVAATGTGKTVVSAFDFKRFYDKNPGAKFLFVAHRKEILIQARNTFRNILRDANFGELWVDGLESTEFSQLFASVQTLNSRLDSLSLTDSFFDYIIIDEVHHIAANSYRPILERFSPKILLGLTATPERMYGGDILPDFDNRIAAEIRLPEALNRKLLTPFQYFGISDTVDLSSVTWRNGKYEIGELTRLYTVGDQRVGHILDNCQRYLTDMNEVKALGFCVSQEHARFMAEKFTAMGLKANYLTSKNAQEREYLRQQLTRGDLNYLFVVDIFNEGVDIPEIDTVLFLRPTESLTVFLQQLGRGLRLSDEKDVLTVLDFVGNARAEYDFEHKFRALVGRTHTSILKEIEDGFPHLPLGCTIVLEKQAREVILANIKAATDLNRRKIIQRIQQFRNQSTRPLTLRNFLDHHQMSIDQLYKFKAGSSYIGWSRLQQEAGLRAEITDPDEHILTRFIGRLVTVQSMHYFRFLKAVVSRGGSIETLKRHLQQERQDSGTQDIHLQPLSTLSDTEIDLMGVMIHHDLWQESGVKLGLSSLEQSLCVFGRNSVLAKEIIEVVDILMDGISHTEKYLDLGFDFPLRVYGRYTRDQILSAMRLHTFEQKSSNREGVAENKDLNCEALFVTLHKSEADYSASTLYEDYAVNEELFHWQSQNATSPESKRGQSYINHRQRDKKILLFVREQNTNQHRNTMSYVYLGPVDLNTHQGSKPMNITWKLHEPIPGYLLKESRKLAVG